MVMISFVMVVIESARIQAANFLVDSYMDIAAQAVLSEYDSVLYERYHVFGTHSDLESTMRYNLNDNMDAGYGFDGELLDNSLLASCPIDLSRFGNVDLFKGFDLFGLKLESLNVLSKETLSGSNGDIFYSQAVSYMKYKAVEKALETLAEKLGKTKGSSKLGKVMKNKTMADTAIGNIDTEAFKLIAAVEGIQFSDKGNIESTQSCFVKKIVYGSISKENVNVNNDIIYEYMEDSYIDVSERIKNLVSANKNVVDRQKTIDDINVQIGKCKKKEVAKKALLEAELKYNELALSSDKGTRNVAANGIRTAMENDAEQADNALLALENVYAARKNASNALVSYQAVLDDERTSLGDEVYKQLSDECSDNKALVLSKCSCITDSEAMKETLVHDKDIAMAVDDMINAMPKEDETDWSEWINLVSGELSGYTNNGLSIEYGEINENTAGSNGILDTVEGLASLGLDSLIFSSLSAISNSYIESPEKRPSVTQAGSAAAETAESDTGFDSLINCALGGDFCENLLGNLTDTAAGAAEKMLFMGYMCDSFYCYTDYIDDAGVYSEKNTGQKNGNAGNNEVAVTDRPNMRYGLEYVLYGHIEDKVNVSISADMLLLLRMGVNFISLLTDSAARGFARETALTLVGFTGIQFLIIAVQTVILLAWAFECAATETNALLLGREIPIWPKEHVILQDELLSFSKALIAEKALLYKRDSKNITDLSYKEYLLMFLMLEDKETESMRTQDLAQDDIRKNCDPSFLMNARVYSFAARADFSMQSKFLRIPFNSGNIFEFIDSYFFGTSCTYSY